MSKVWGGVLAVTGLVACPCHLPLTLPLLLGVLGGTGIGSIIGANTGLIYGLTTGYFLGGIGVGLYLLNRKKRASAACDIPQSKRANGRLSKKYIKRRSVDVSTSRTLVETLIDLSKKRKKQENAGVGKGR